MPVRQYYSVIEKTTIEKFYNDQPRHVTVWLEDHGEPTGVHCMYCKKKLFEMQHSIIQIAPGSPPTELKNIKIKCPNPGCSTYYYFVSVV